MSGKTVDWQDEAFRLGFNQDYNVSISGAGDKVDYYMSLGYLRNEGAFVDDTYRAIRANLKLNAKVTDWFEVRMVKSAWIKVVLWKTARMPC